MHKWLFIPLLILGCGQSPKHLYVRDQINLDPEVQTQVSTAITQMNTDAQNTFITIGGSGDKPISIQMKVPAAGSSDILAHARYEEYHCLIEIRNDIWQAIQSSLQSGGVPTPSDDQIRTGIKYVIMHEVGHCYGLGHNNVDATDIMYPYYQDQWTEASAKRQAQKLNSLTP